MHRKSLHFFIGLIIIVLSIYYAFKGVKLSELSQALMSVRYVYLIPATMLILIIYLLRAMRWRYLIRPVKDVKTTSLFSPLMVGFMSNLLLARAGEFIRAFLLSKKENISFSASFATIFIERLFDLIVLLLLSIWVLLFMPEAFTPRNQGSEYMILNKVKIFGFFTFLLCICIILLSTLLQFRNQLVVNLVELCVKPLPLRWKDKIRKLVISFAEGLNIIRDKKGLFTAVSLSFLIWAAFVIFYYPLYMALGIDSELPVISSALVLCLTISVFISLAPTPGFLGSYHLACVVVLHGIYGIQKAIALSYGIVAWLIAMGFTVVTGLIFAIKDHVSFGEISTEKEQM